MSFAGRAFASLVRRVGAEMIPSHVEIRTSFDRPILEGSADAVEVMLVDKSGSEPLYGVFNVTGEALRSPHAEDVIRHELRGLAEKMGYA